ncbi:MAG: oligopeptidase A [Gammaproteobacteria bacterium]|nr:oligopeptidase A [Gammaproteobacteria bacterium]
MSNPLLDITGLPAFSQIKPEHVVPAIEQLLTDNRARVEKLLGDTAVYTWDNLVQPLEDMDDHLSQAFSPVSHMNSVVNSDELREAYNACLPLLSDYATEMGQNEGLFKAFQQISEGEEYDKLDAAQKKVIDNALRDFRLAGVDLPPEKQARYKTIQQELSQLTSKFSDNLLDATNAWHKQVTDESLLAGLPESSVGMAKQAAEERELEGWVFTLEFPSYYGVMSYADNRELREELYKAYVTRASDQGPNAGQWDNTEVMEKILDLRHELAQLLGFANYAERSLATKMAPGPDKVLEFLKDLANRSLGMAQEELDELRAFAKDKHGINELQNWDIAYYSEKLQQEKYNFSEEDLKPYFPETKVIPGMFEVVKRLYGLNIEEVKGVDTWHKDVRFYEIKNDEGEVRGQFYLDLYARSKKRGGAWMDECVARKREPDGSVQTPVAYLTCNFAPPVGGKPALLTHDEVITLFHEFGHGLHHMLTQIDYVSVSGISGVAWDAVELPSQFMENWCWEREAVDLISGHYKTGDKLPDDLYNKMYAAKNFQAGMQMVRQLEFSMFDFRLHLEHKPEEGARIQEILDEVRAEVAVVPQPSYNRFQHSFAHIFAGGYAAGYYSYKWAEVLSSDAFSKFEENGIFDRKTGVEFLEAILEQGGSREPMELFKEFRGREPEIEALLRHSGIVEAA